MFHCVRQSPNMIAATEPITKRRTPSVVRGARVSQQIPPFPRFASTATIGSVAAARVFSCQLQEVG
jgi:hypothetical protein